VNKEWNLETVIHIVWWCTWRTRSRELWDGFEGHAWGSAAIHFQAMIRWVWKCVWIPWSSELGAVHEGDQSAGGRSERMCDGCLDSVHWFTESCGNAQSQWQQQGLPRCESGELRWDGGNH
jgi:hypothetical protein